MANDPYGDDFKEEVLRIINRTYDNAQPTVTDTKKNKNKTKIPWFVLGAASSRLINTKAEQRIKEREQERKMREEEASRRRQEERLKLEKKREESRRRWENR